MHPRLLVAALAVGLTHDVTSAGELSKASFEDGLWRGGLERATDDNSDECWARTTFDNGTDFTLAKKRDGNWTLRISSPSWVLPFTRHFTMAAQVDFYPVLEITAEAKSKTMLEIAGSGQNALFSLIENGHTIDLTAEGFNAKYSLEGSAKIIERIRTCYSDFLAR